MCRPDLKYKETRRIVGGNGADAGNDGADDGNHDHENLDGALNAATGHFRRCAEQEERDRHRHRFATY